MCKCKLCDWVKSLFGKKCEGEEKGCCCGEKKVEEITSEPKIVTEEKKDEETIA